MLVLLRTTLCFKIKLLATYMNPAISWLKWSRYLILAWNTRAHYRCISEFTNLYQFNSLHAQAFNSSVVRLMTTFSSKLRPLTSTKILQLKFSKHISSAPCTLHYLPISLTILIKLGEKLWKWSLCHFHCPPVNGLLEGQKFSQTVSEPYYCLSFRKRSPVKEICSPDTGL
jgi:hypothetical protein